MSFRGFDRNKPQNRPQTQPQNNVSFLEPNKNVTITEDTYIKALRVDMANSKFKKLSLESKSNKTNDDRLTALRPAYGTQGAPTKLIANYFSLDIKRDITLFPYTIRVCEKNKTDGEGPKGRMLRKCFEMLLGKSGWENAITDFKLNVYLRQPALSTAPITLQDMSSSSTNPKFYVYTINKESVPGSFRDLLNMLQATSPSTSTSLALNSLNETALQTLNILTSHNAQVDDEIVSVAGKKFFGVRGHVDEKRLSKQLTAIRGYYKSVRLATGRILLNVNTTYAVFVPSMPLTEYIDNSKASPKELERLLKKMKVKVSHEVDSNGGRITRIKTITGLADTNDGEGLEHKPKVTTYGASPNNIQFYLEKKVPSRNANIPPGYTTISNYFQNRYNMKTSHHPAVNVGSRNRPSYLPANACQIVEGQVSHRKLDMNQTTSMLEFANKAPHMNARLIRNQGRRVFGLDKQNGKLVDCGITVAPDLVSILGRVLKHPRIEYKMSNKEVKERGDWNMTKILIVSPKPVGKLHVLWIRTTKDSSTMTPKDVTKYTKNFLQICLKQGMNIQPQPAVTREISTAIQTTEETIKAISANILQISSIKQNKFLLVILPEKTTSIYNAIKTACDTVYGIPSVCCVREKFCVEWNPQYWANVGLKLNLKAGGINHRLSTPELGIISNGATMVVGLDVTHPSAGSKEGAPSIAAMVASIDKHLAQFPVEISINKAREEMVSQIGDMLRTRLKAWTSLNPENKKLPENIIVYRDGVSEGEYNKVLEIELQAMRTAARQMYDASATKSGLPRFTVIIVGKRHHTRFYAGDGKGDLRNPDPGTVVDRGITYVRNFDFFLQAHHALKGTARPAHYYVIHDEIFSTKIFGNQTSNAADDLQRLTFNMCHLFGRATKVVSLCPPVYYAHLACERARRYLADQFEPSTTGSQAGSNAGSSKSAANRLEIHPNLKDTMFYI